MENTSKEVIDNNINRSFEKMEALHFAIQRLAKEQISSINWHEHQNN